ACEDVRRVGAFFEETQGNLHCRNLDELTLEEQGKRHPRAGGQSLGFPVCLGADGRDGYYHLGSRLRPAWLEGFPVAPGNRAPRRVDEVGKRVWQAELRRPYTTLGR